MSTSVKVEAKPDCDLCGNGTKADYDAKTKLGPWANMCQAHYDELGVGLGLGLGQKFEVV